MPIELSGLSSKQLDALIAQARKRKSVLGKRKPAATVRAKLVALAKAEGYAIEELFGTGGALPRGSRGGGTTARKAGRKAAKKTARSAVAKKRVAKKRVAKPDGRAKVAPKYRNPENAKETWTGRGKQPRWLAEQVRRGKSPTDFLINAAPTPKPMRAGKRVVKASRP